MPIESIDHVQLAMPVGQEDAAREFYSNLLGPEVSKPPALAARGGVWFEDGRLKVHLGGDPDFRPAWKAHPAFVVRGLAELTRRLEDAGIEIMAADSLPGQERRYIVDPFGNRIELIEYPD